MYFGSDNQTGASSQVLAMLTQANSGYTHGYGDDQWTNQAVEALKTLFECDLEAYFVATGTAANSLALSCMVKPWESVLCHDSAHIILDESTAPELFTGGARMRSISQGEGKMSPKHLQDYLQTIGTDYPHNVRAAALSITQASESGLVYTPEQVSALSRMAKDNGLSVHMDGARFANAVASQQCTPAELSWKAGVDVLCLGATKCGALCAEVVIFFNKELADTFTHRRKRGGHLLSKGRLFGAQMVGWLKDDHWLDLAQHANTQATQLAKKIATFGCLQLVWPVESNELFVIMPKGLAEHLQAAGAEFYDWYVDTLPPNITINENEIFARLVTSFITQDAQCEDFCELIRDYLSAIKA
ncbi:MAG: beta-eliminating lyase-related protein [Porticoccaceae bacterium]|jgi:threonine aldolase|nr:beta-eliminating lyase-related protein [Porticoccaceae bacterium]|tara:strand:+ start:460 stop:1536 length:1077 start_codon:yes stop_codon:yes gene_type:complete